MVWHLPVLQGCVIHCTSYIFPEAGESFRKAGDMGGEFVSDPQFLLAGHPPMLILAVLLACAGPGLGLLFGLLVSLHLVCLFSVLKCRFCTGFSSAILVIPSLDGLSDLFLGLVLDFSVISPCRCRCFNTEWSDASLFMYASNTWSAASYLSSQNI